MIHPLTLILAALTLADDPLTLEPQGAFAAKLGYYPVLRKVSRTVCALKADRGTRS